jgi:hypothetical protein
MRRVPGVVAICLVAGIFAGCGDRVLKPIPSQTSDRDQVIGAVGSAPTLTDDGLLSDSQPIALSAGTPDPLPASSTAIQPQSFWRTITTTYRGYTLAFADTDSTGRPTTAIVTIRTRLLGTFNIAPDTGDIIHKPLDDLSVRRVQLHRIQWPEGSGEAIWRIGEVSGAEVTSIAPDDRHSTIIFSLRVQAGDLDTTITDPLALFRLRSILRFQSNQIVTLTATTWQSTDVVLLYAAGHRERMTDNGDGSYTGTFSAGTSEGWRHFGVNVLLHGTLYDDTVPYDSKAWILPYVINWTPETDYVP